MRIGPKAFVVSWGDGQESGNEPSVVSTFSERVHLAEMQPPLLSLMDYFTFQLGGLPSCLFILQSQDKRNVTGKR